MVVEKRSDWNNDLFAERSPKLPTYILHNKQELTQVAISWHFNNCLSKFMLRVLVQLQAHPDHIHEQHAA